jgi:hypothetical protein
MSKAVSAAVIALSRHVKYDDVHNKKAVQMPN